jgi:hypothetical protein
MRNLQRLFAAFGLAVALTLPVLAGEIQTGLVDPPPPPANHATSSESRNASNGAMDAVESFSPDYSVAEISLNLLQRVLFLF